MYTVKKVCDFVFLGMRVTTQKGGNSRSKEINKTQIKKLKKLNIRLFNQLFQEVKEESKGE
jgi:hypothetical protein